MKSQLWTTGYNYCVLSIVEKSWDTAPQFTFSLQFTFGYNSLVHDSGLGIMYISRYVLGSYVPCKMCGTYVAFQSGLARRQPLELVDASKAKKMVALFHVV